MEGFAAGDAQWEGDVARWITKWIWEKPLSERDGETWIATDGEEGNLVGYGTWSHVDAFGAHSVARHIEIAWFGVDVAYQGRSDERGSIAGQIYSAIEVVARRHPESTDDMPFTLACHVENERGRRFWEARGYRVIPDPKLRIEDEVYHRMVR